MGYQIKSTSDLVALMNAANAASVAEADLTFSNPQATGGTWKGLTTDKNTVIKVTATEASKYQGSQSFLYDRLNLANLTKLQGLKLYADAPAKVSDLIEPLRFYAGIVLLAANVNGNDAVTNNGDGTYTATITANASSIGWYGSVTLTFTQGGAKLSTVVSDTDLDGLNYPTASDQDTYGPLYLYPYDFTAYYSDINALAAGTLSDANATKLAADINAVDIGGGKTLWNADSTQTAWSVQGATVVFNGLNGSDYPTNPAYKYVLVLQLRSGVNTPAGLLYLHYNDPVNTASV